QPLLATRRGFCALAHDQGLRRAGPLQIVYRTGPGLPVIMPVDCPTRWGRRRFFPARDQNVTAFPCRCVKDSSTIRAPQGRGTEMRKLLVGTAVLALAASGSAFAADIPVKAPRAPIVAPVIYTWTGCYIGGHVGYHRTRQSG